MVRELLNKWSAMKKTSLHNGSGTLGRRGFSLLELLIVVAILGILSVAVGVYINSNQAKLRNSVFNLSAQFRKAKFEAIKRNSNVYMDFDFDNDGDPLNDNGFTIWQDNTDDPNYDSWDPATNDLNGNGICDRGDDADCLIETVKFENRTNSLYGKEGPEIYDTTATGGPAAGPLPDAEAIGNGVTAANARFLFRPNGDCSNSGSIYLYFPAGGGGARRVDAGPWAIKVNNVGRISIDEWQAASADWKVN